LSGIFLDSFDNYSPQVDLTNPSGGSIHIQPNPILLQAEASDTDGQLVAVEFFADSEKLGQSAEMPFTLLWTNAWVGDHALTARAIDNFGSIRETAPVVVSIRPPSAAATFVTNVSASSGDWIGSYGSEGFGIPGHATNFPLYASVTFNQGISFVWSDPTDDIRALDRIDAPGRIASCWFDHERIHWDLDLLDGRDHEVSLYFLDWDSDGGRDLLVNVWDFENLQPLDSRRITEFRAGAFYTWIIRGTVRFEIVRISANAVVSGLFFGPAPPVPSPPALNLVETGSTEIGFPQLMLKGEAYHLYLIEVSTNLIDWSPWETCVMPAWGSISFSDGSVPIPETRFYRAVLVR
jgi:hypothetical protein